jgi:hypothetical protein
MIAPLAYAFRFFGGTERSDDGYVVFDTLILPDILDSVSLPAGRLDVALSRRDDEVAAHVIARRGAAGILVRA